jgi:hypothetical protein
MVLAQSFRVGEWGWRRAEESEEARKLVQVAARIRIWNWFRLKIFDRSQSQKLKLKAEEPRLPVVGETAELPRS